MSTFPERLKDAREARGWNQIQLADAIGMSPGAVGNWEAGTRKTVRDLLGLAKALQVNPDWLMHGTGVRQADKDTQTGGEVAQEVSYQAFKVPPLKTREEVLSGRNLGELFTYTVTDDATWKSYPRGLQIIFRTTGEPRIGKAVLVASGDSVHVRIFAQGATESDWSAVAQGDGYKDFHSSDGSVIRGYYKGQIDPDD